MENNVSMLITVSKDLYRYEADSLVQAFYPAEHVKVVVEGSEDYEKALRSGVVPFMRVEYSPGKITARILAGMSEECTAPAGVNFAEKSPACKTSLKHLIYHLLCTYTGRNLPWGELIGVRPTKIAMRRLTAGDTPQQAVRFMQDQYHVSLRKAEEAVDIAGREHRLLSGIHYENGYSLYIGIPFCPTTCLYCSFPSFSIEGYREYVDEYLKCLEQEMAATAPLMRNRVLDTVYIGGGTPTTLSERQLEWLIDTIRHYFDTDRVLEFTVEAGRADSITMDKLKALRRCGIDRISVNPQTMQDRTLRLIGRRAVVQQVIDAFHMARKAGFDNINMDIILGLPGETEKDVASTIEQIAALQPDNLTVHSLAIKRASRLRTWIDEHGYRTCNTDRMMDIAYDGALRMNMKPYYLYRQKQMEGNLENVGFAREGKAGLYNILIMEEKQSILALGAGAVAKRVGRDGSIERADNAKDVATFIRNIDGMTARLVKLFSQAAED